MSDLVPFNFDGRQVRVIVDLEGNPWWVAADVCAVLGIADAHRAASRLDEADRRSTPIRSGSQSRQMLMVNESGLYDLVLDSRKPEARKFRRWITSEVLPSLRQTGSYSAAPAPRSQLDVLRGALDQIEAAQIQAAEAKEIAERSEARLDAIEGRHEWFAALGYARLNGLPTSAIYLQRLGTTASQIGRRAGITPNKVEHALYGVVNQWPAWVWAAAVEDRQG